MSIIQGSFQKKRFKTLKSKLTAILILSSCIPLALIGITSLYSITSIQKNKITTGVYSALNQAKLGIENTLNNLNYASKQLILNGKIGEDLNRFLSTDNPYEKVTLKADIDESLRIINFSNQDLGLMFYYLPNEKTKIQFENLEVRPDFDMDTIPVVAKQSGISYYGPHKTAYRYGNNIVLSMVREAYIPGKRKIYVYMETNYKIVQRLLNSQKYGMDVCHFLLDAEGKIAFAEENREFGDKKYFTDFLHSWSKSNGNKDGFMIFTDKSELGWEIGAVIKKSDFNREIDKWMHQFMVITAMTLLISVFFAISIWRKVYLPIRILSRQIKLVGNNTFDSPLSFTDIQEFDSLLLEFSGMRKKIQNLLGAVEQKEKRKRHLEVERLLYQINPHFLCNSLDTVRWMARLNGQNDIDKTVSALNRLLHYNLGKQGELTTIKEELDVLKDYVTVQKMRYDFEYSQNIDPKALDVIVPRFIFQPLVENSLKHGLKEDGKIDIVINLVDDSRMLIEVRDNGSGMTDETKRKLLEQDFDKARENGLGIGIQYIRNIIEVYYGDNAVFDIKSDNVWATIITLNLPAKYLDMRGIK